MSNQNSRQVEERVVSMQFDNSQFERNTKQTLSTLDKLKSKLQFKGASESLREFSRESSKFNLNGVSAAVETCGQKLDAWSIAGITAIANLTNSAVNAGKKITNALTIEPVFTGFQEYETKINAIQTIMSNTRSKGTTMEQVVDTLDELNKYADLTIYNFAEMTKNIGTFTAAGIELEDAASAIQGIANLAAASGSTSQQASTAMYQLSQALAAGSLKLQDWNSVVNAGMGGQLFQEALKQTARETGIAVDEMIESAGSFRESLQKGWISTDILSTTLRKFTRTGAKEYAEAMIASGDYTEEMAQKLQEEAASMEDAATKVKTFTQLWDTLKETAQSGWGKTWELIIGNFDQAQELFTKINDRISPVIDRISDARNTVIEGAMGSPSKWDEMIEKMNKAGIATSAFEDSLRTTLSRRNIDMDQLIEQYGSLKAAFSDGPLDSHYAVEAMKRVASEQMRFGTTTMSAGERLEYFQNKVNEVWRGDWDNGAARVEKLTAANHDYEAIQELVNKTMDGSTLTLEDMSTAQLRVIGLTEEEITEIESLRSELNKSDSMMRQFIDTLDGVSGRQLLFDSLMNTMDAIASVVKPIGAAFREVFAPIESSDIYGFLEGLQKFTKGMILTDEQANKLQRTFKGVFSILGAIKSILSSGVRLVLRIVGALLGNVNLDILSITAAIGDQLTVLSKWIKEHDLVNKVMEKIGPTLESAGKAISVWMDKLKQSDNLPRDIINGIGNGIAFAAKIVGDAFKGLFESLGVNIDNILESLNLKNLGSSIGDIMIAAKNAIKGSFSLKNIAKETKDAGKTIMVSTGEGIKNAGSFLFEAFKNVFSKIGAWLKENVDPGAVVAGVFIGSMMHTLNTLAGIVDKFAAPSEALAGMFNNIGKAFKSLAGLVDALKFNSVARGVMMLAISVGILAGSIFLISKIPEEDLNRSVRTIVGMSVVVLAMTGLLALCNRFVAQSGGIDFGILAGLAIGLLGVTLSIKMLADESPDKLNYALVYMVTCMTTMVALVGVLSVLTKNAYNANIKALGPMMVMFGASMLLLSLALKSISKLEKRDIKRGMAVIAGAGAIFAALILSSKVLKEKSMVGFAMAIFAMSRAIRYLVKTIPLAASISDADLKQAMKVMAGVALIMGGLALISKIGGRFTSGLAVLGFATAMIVVAYTIKYINTIGMNEIDYATLIITSIGALFLKFLTVSFMAGKNAAKAGLMLIEASVAMGIMAGIIYIIGGMEEERVNRGLVAVGALATFMAKMIKATRGAESIMGSIIALAICVAILSAAAFALAFVPAKKLAKSVAALSIMVLSMAVLLRQASRIKASSFKSLIVAFVGMSILLGEVLLITMVLSGLSAFFNKFDPIKTIAALAMMMTSLGVLLYAMGKSATSLNAAGFKGVMKIVGELAILSLIFIELALVLKVVSLIGNPTASWETLLQMTTLLVILSGVAIALSKFVGNAQLGNVQSAVLVIAELGVVMAELAVLLWFIGDVMKPDNASWNTLAQISALLIVLTAVSIALTRFSGSADIGSLNNSFKMMLALGVVMLELAAVLWVISNYLPSDVDWKTIEQISLMLGVLVLVSIPLALIGKFTGNILSGAVGLGALAVVMLILGYTMSLMTDLNPLQAIAIAESLCTMLLTLVGVCVVCIPLGALAELALIGIGVLALLAASLAVGLDLFVKLGVGEDLVKTGQALGAFGTAMGPFVQMLSTVSVAAQQGADSIASIFKSLSAALGYKFLNELLGGIGWGEHIKDDLVSFGEAVVAFSNTISGKIDNGAIVASSMCALMLASLNDAMPREIPWLEWLIGKKDIGAFGQKLSTFAEAMVEFGKVTKDKNLDKDSIKTFCEAVEPILTIAKDIPNSGGLLGLLAGNNDIDQWGAKLTPFARYMLGFNNVLKHADWNKEPFEKFKDCVTPILTIADEIPNSGGLIGAIVGNNDIDVFGKRLTEFGTGMGGLYDAVNGKNWDKTLFESVQECVAVLIDVSHDLDNTGGMIQFFAGQQDLGSFGTQLALFGSGLAGFDAAITGASSFSSGIALRMTKDIKSLAAAMPTKDEIKTICDRVNDMTHWNLEARLEELGSVLTTFAASTSTLSNTNIDSASTSLKLLASALSDASNLNFANLSEFGGSIEKLGEIGIDAFVDAFENSYSKVSEAINSFMYQIETLFDMHSYRWIFIGRHAVEDLGDGISAKTEFAKDDLIRLMIQLSSTAESYGYMFETVGGYLVQGLANGIRNNIDVVKSASGDLGQAAAEALADALKVQSPSKVTTEIGEYVGMGFVNGLKEYISISEGTAEQLGDNTTSTLTDILLEALALFDDSQLHPTITPVLDLSMIRDGVDTMSGLMNVAPVHINSIGSIGNNNSATNDDIIRAINDLSNSLGNVGGDTYNIGDIKYDDGSAVGTAVKELLYAAKVARRV